MPTEIDITPGGHARTLERSRERARDRLLADPLLQELRRISQRIGGVTTSISDTHEVLRAKSQINPPQGFAMTLQESMHGAVPLFKLKPVELLPRVPSIDGPSETHASTAPPTAVGFSAPATSRSRDGGGTCAPQRLDMPAASPTSLPALSMPRPATEPAARAGPSAGPKAVEMR